MDKSLPKIRIIRYVTDEVPLNTVAAGNVSITASHRPHPTTGINTIRSLNPHITATASTWPDGAGMRLASTSLSPSSSSSPDWPKLVSVHFFTLLFSLFFHPNFHRSIAVGSFYNSAFGCTLIRRNGHMQMSWNNWIESNAHLLQEQGDQHNRVLMTGQFEWSRRQMVENLARLRRPAGITSANLLTSFNPGWKADPLINVPRSRWN